MIYFFTIKSIIIQIQIKKWKIKMGNRKNVNPYQNNNEIYND